MNETAHQPYDIAREALAEPFPCDGCRHAKKCAQLAWACDSFVLFTHGASARRWQVAEREPSKLGYRRAMGDSAS